MQTFSFFKALVLRKHVSFERNRSVEGGIIRLAPIGRTFRLPDKNDEAQRHVPKACEEKYGFVRLHVDR